MIGIPFMFDQNLNMYLAEQKGYGICVPYDDLSVETLSSAVNRVLGNSRYTNHTSAFRSIRFTFTVIFSYTHKAKLISDRFRDQPLNPLKTAMHWVKHVAKNKEAPHLRSVAVDLSFYALYNLDVWAVIATALLSSLFITLRLIGAISSICFPTKTGTKQKTS